MHPLIKLVLETFEKNFGGEEPVVSEEIKRDYSEKIACFIRVLKKGEMRSFYGSLRPKNILYKEIISYSQKIVTGDKKFKPLKKEELSTLKVHIYLVKNIVDLDFEDEKSLLAQLDSNDGVYIEKEFQSAVFLPYVWEDISNKEEFLSTLCEEAGIKKDSWKKLGVKIKVFEVDEIV